MPSIPLRIRNIIRTKQAFSDVYYHVSSRFAQDEMRQRVFAIKSFLSSDAPTNDRLYIPINIAKTVVHSYADYVIGQGYSVTFGDPHLQTTYETRASALNLEKSLYDAVVSTSLMVYGLVRVRQQDGQVVLESIPLMHYFPAVETIPLGGSLLDATEHSIISIQAPTDLEPRRTAHIDRYQQRGTGRLARYEVYEYSPAREYTSDLLIARKWEEFLQRLPLFVLSNDINNSDEGLQIGQSDIADVMELIQDLNDRQTQMSVEFIKHLQSKMSVPESAFRAFQQAKHRQSRQEDGDDSDGIAFEWLVHGQGEDPAHYITKDSSMLALALEQQDRTLRFIASVTRVPITFFGLEEKSGNKHVGTVIREMDSFLRRVGAKRRGLRPVLRQLLAYAMWLQTGVYSLPRLEFSSLVQDDEDQTVDRVIKLLDAGLITKKQAGEMVFGER